MSVRDQTHQHRWQRRVKDWLIVPHSAYPNPRDVTLAELQSHNTRGDCWLCVHGVVYDVSRFMPYHPGGTKIIEQYAGRDCTPAYMRNHLKLDPEDVVPNCRVGLLISSTGEGAPSHSKDAPPPYVDRRSHLTLSSSQDLSAVVDRMPSSDAASLAELAAASGLYADVGPEALASAVAAVETKKDDVTEQAAIEALFSQMDVEGTGLVRKEALSLLLDRIGGKDEGDDLLASCPDFVTREQFVALVQSL